MFNEYSSTLCSALLIAIDNINTVREIGLRFTHKDYKLIRGIHICLHFHNTNSYGTVSSHPHLCHGPAFSHSRRLSNHELISIIIFYH